MAKKEGKSEISRIAWADEMTKEEMNAFVEKEKENLAKMSEISISLSTYNDIFSSFDPRPYGQRALSDDFLDEAKKASMVKDVEDIELKLLMPASKRNISEETVIKKRLKDYFKKHESIAKQEVKSILWKGVIFMIVGAIFMLIATWLIHRWDEGVFFVSFLIILLEPGGWFFFWEGLAHLVYKSKEKGPETEFLKKMSSCQIGFYSY